MKKLSSFILYFLCLSAVQVFAQQKDLQEPQTRTAQLSLITPLGTNGMESYKITNHLSLNMIAGYNGGLSGVELGGFANVIKEDVSGVQIAGFSNLVFGKAIGVQCAGFSNVVLKNALQTQIAGFANVVKGNVDGTQMAGFANFDAARAKGTQIAGFANVCLDTCKGVQIAGYANIAAKDFTGVQVSGFFNFTHRLKGLQLGVVNYCDTVETGIPLGFISIVKHGYHAVELGGDESLYLQGSFKTGVKHFYNIFTLGYRPIDGKTLWGVAYGLGSNIKLSNKFDLQIEASSAHINADESWTESLSLLNKLKLNLSANLTNRISLFGGVSYNVFIGEKKKEDGSYKNEEIVPWTSQTITSGSHLLKMYPGFSFGLRYQI